ncbi:lectin [Armillaria borealis]|uniref:Lectin n=1 Tax=Armillaria borealis TaxID=47425 RepID=A0AA39MRJ7_9AGAR|nr:lectin [Armillaria borealis]
MFFKVLLLLPAFLSTVAGSALLPSEISAKATSGLSSNALLPRLLDARAVAPVLDFSHSSYIWTGEQAGTAHTAPAGMRPFRAEIPSSATKCPTCATIIVACDDQCPVYVNGQQIGTGKSPQQGAVVYTAGLNPDSKNVFAIGVSNTAEGSAGLIATILVDYTDGTTETIVSDSMWKTLKGVAPGGWTSPSFNDSAWTAADQTDEDVSSGSAPRGRRPFRKTFTSPYGKAAVCGKIVLSVEDSYTLYVNGKTIGTGSNWHAMQAYSLPKLDPDVNVVAVDGENDRGNSRVWLGAGVLIAYNDGSSETYYTDGSWKTLNALPPAGFEQPDADDSEWVGATIWGPVASSDATIPDA